MAIDLYQVRQDTAGCADVIHLNNAGAALVPDCVADAIREYVTEEQHGGAYEVAAKHADEVAAFYDYAAQLLGCKSRNIAYTTSATDSYNRALSSVPFRAGDVVLISENDYPSNFIAFLSLQKRQGIRLVTVRNNEYGEVDLNDLDEKLRQHKPRLVSVTHVPTSSGLVQPVEAIGTVIKKYDAVFLLDACQSIGQMVVDARQTKADFISGTMRKFLRGPRGTGLLYVSDSALEAGLEPLLPDMRGADWVAENEYRSRSDARRFEDWENAYALMLGSKEALRYVTSIGIENIEQRNLGLAKNVRERLSNINGVRLQDQGRRLCSIITFTIDGKDESATKTYFSQRGINIHSVQRGAAMIDFPRKAIDWVVRISPHYYNSEAEIDTFFDVLYDWLQ